MTNESAEETEHSIHAQFGVSGERPIDRLHIRLRALVRSFEPVFYVDGVTANI